MTPPIRNSATRPYPNFIVHLTSSSRLVNATFLCVSSPARTDFSFSKLARDTLSSMFRERVISLKWYWAPWFKLAFLSPHGTSLTIRAFECLHSKSTIYQYHKIQDHRILIIFDVMPLRAINICMLWLGESSLIKAADAMWGLRSLTKPRTSPRNLLGASHHTWGQRRDCQTI